MKQIEKILTVMCREGSGKWFFPYDFMQGQPYDELFVGYEASARLSELAKLYPEMIESQHDGKYIKRRIVFTKKWQWYPGLPKELQAIFDSEYKPVQAVPIQHD